MDKEIKVSIILPTWKEPKFIELSIKSILNQSFFDWELLIFDDGLASEKIRNLITQYTQNDKRIYFFQNLKNLGIQKTLNKGLEIARGEYVARIDDDDEWVDKDKLKKQIEFLDKNPDFGLVGVGAIIVIDRKRQELFKYQLPESDKEIRKMILSKNCFVHSGVVFKKKLVLDLGGYNEHFSTKHIEDYDLWLKIGIVSRFYNLPEIQIKFMQGEDSISSKNKVGQLKRNINLIRKYKGKYPNYHRAKIIGYLRLLFLEVYKIIPFGIQKIIFKFYKESI